MQVERLAGYGKRARDFARAHRSPAPGGTWLDNPDFKVFWDAPALVLICRGVDKVDADWDCCRAGQNLMLAAHARGLGTCWVGSPMPWLRSAEGAAEVGIPEGFEAVAPIVVGYAASEPPAREPPSPQVVWMN